MLNFRKSSAQAHPDAGRTIALRWPRPRRAGGKRTLRQPVAPLNAARTAQGAVPTFVLALLALVLLSGCAGSKPGAEAFPRHFVFEQDTLAYSNQLYWVYNVDPVTGKTTHEEAKPKPTYALHCFAVARAARLFFQHAQFDTNLPPADAATYRTLVRQVLGRSANLEVEEDERVVIPGYANLHEFSLAHEKLLKAECGGIWRSYLQRGNWRMIFPFTKRHQEKMAWRLVESIRRRRPPVVHISDFPTLHVNHAVVLFDAREGEKEIEFYVYDPNNASKPALIKFDRATRRFHFSQTFYYAGGRVNVYEVYYGSCY